MRANMENELGPKFYLFAQLAWVRPALVAPRARKIAACNALEMEIHWGRLVENQFQLSRTYRKKKN